MEKVKAKDFLRRHEISSLKIRALEEEIKNLYESLLKAPANDGQPRGSGKSDSTGIMASKIADMRLESEYLWEQQQLIRRQIERTLYQLEDADDFRVCWAKYIELKDWQEIAAEIDKTERTAQRIHGRALLEVQAIIDKRAETEKPFTNGG